VRRWRLGSAQEGERPAVRPRAQRHSVRPHGHAGRSGRGRAVPRLHPCALGHRSDDRGRRRAIADGLAMRARCADATAQAFKSEWTAGPTVARLFAPRRFEALEEGKMTRESLAWAIRCAAVAAAAFVAGCTTAPAANAPPDMRILGNFTLECDKQGNNECWVP